MDNLRALVNGGGSIYRSFLVGTSVGRFIVFKSRSVGCNSDSERGLRLFCEVNYIFFKTIFARFKNTKRRETTKNDNNGRKRNITTGRKLQQHCHQDRLRRDNLTWRENRRQPHGVVPVTYLHVYAGEGAGIFVIVHLQRACNNVDQVNWVMSSSQSPTSFKSLVNTNIRNRNRPHHDRHKNHHNHNHHHQQQHHHHHHPHCSRTKADQGYAL